MSWERKSLALVQDVEESSDTLDINAGDDMMITSKYS